MRLRDLVVDYLINNTRCRGRDRREREKEEEKEFCHEGKDLCKVPARRQGVSKNLCTSVNIPREFTEGESGRVLVQEPRQGLVVVALGPPVSEGRELGDIPGAFAQDVPS